MKNRIRLLCLVAGALIITASTGFDSFSLGAEQAQHLHQPQNIVTESVPPVPTTLAEQLDRYGYFRTAHLNSWHPLRKEMLIGTTFGDVNQIHLVSMPQGARTQQTFSRERSGSASFQPTSGDFFIFSRDRGGNENYQKYLLWPESRKQRLLTDGVSRNRGTVWSTEGDRFAYSSNRRNPKDMDLYIVEPGNPDAESKLIAELEGEGWGANDWSADDTQILLHEYVSINEIYLWLLDVKSGEKRLITPRQPGTAVAYRGGVFSRDGRHIYVTTDRDSEFQRLARLDPATGELEFLTPDNWDVDDFHLSWDGRRIAYATNEEGFTVLHILDLKSGKTTTPNLPRGLISGLLWHKNDEDLGFTLENATTPADVYSCNRATTEVTRWTHSETGDFDAATAVEPEIISWPSFDGRMIPGLLYRPPAHFKGPRPVIVSIHGGPESQARPGYLGRLNYYMNELGVAMIFPNVRGSSGYGKTYLQLDNGFKREDAFKDIEALFDWIEKQPYLDSKRVMVSGSSYGGFMTLAVATRYSDRIACAVDIVGISNLVTFLENTSAYRQDLRRAEYGDERDPAMREFMLRIAPALNASSIKKPLFVVQGENDPRVPTSEALQMVAEVRKAETPVWFLMAKDEGHGFSRKQNTDYLFYATVLFVRKFLLGEDTA